MRALAVISVLAFSLAPLKAQQQELPWEVATDQGEVVLPNLFYVEASENEQIMPLALEGQRCQIDRLIYPTIGNPNLFERDKDGDELLVVLRLEETLYEHLRPKDKRVDSRPTLQTLTLKEDESNRLAFFLVDRHGGGPDLGASPERTVPSGKVLEIRPSRILIHRQRGVPDEFRNRRTLRVYFDREALSGVPDGLYDLRFESLEDGRLAAPGAFELQYNAVRIFDRGSAPDGSYAILNVTDTQASTGLTFRRKTMDRLAEFVAYVNRSDEPEVRNAAFITFNGDLHNGGAPEFVLSEEVATSYLREAREIFGILKTLRLPIFLTIGNHDGYVSMGQEPAFAREVEKRLGKPSLEEVVEQASPKAWPGFSMAKFKAFTEATKETPGGRHVDVFAGRHIRRAGQSFNTWIELPEKERNLVLYDGFYQWRRTYGPLFTSWSFGKNLYINLNSFELRQHRRSGWGMYTVNYGGGMSQAQLYWLNRVLVNAQRRNEDIVLLAHHDPRGGHNGKDYPYYFRMIEYTGIGVSAKNYVVGEILNPILCDKIPEGLKSRQRKLGCMHDGLQEWMRADVEFDCRDEDRLRNGRCDLDLMRPDADNQMRKHPYYSGYALIDQLAKRFQVRTLLLGHTHYNALEILQEGDEIVPGTVTLDEASHKTYEELELTNPMRGFSQIWGKLTGRPPGERVYDPKVLELHGIEQENELFVLRLEAAGHTFARTVRGTGRELAILRLTTEADLSAQKYGSAPNYGFSVFHVTRKDRYPLPQINQVSFFLNDPDGPGFRKITTIDLPRDQRVGKGDEPLAGLFTME